MSELICSIPPRPTVEALIASLKGDMDYTSHLTVIHFPTLEEQCEEFWNEPEAMSLAWLAQLFALLALGVKNCQESDTPLENCASPDDTIYLYTLRSAQSLVKSNYMKPTKHTIEALVSG